VLGGSCGPRTRVTTVALATPFIHVRARAVDNWSLFVIVLFGAFLLVGTVGTAAAGPRSPAEMVLLIGGGGFTALLALCVAGWVLHRRSLGPGWRSRLVAAIHAPATQPAETIIIRASGDEASGLLVAGQFVGWLSAGAARLLSNLWLWAAVIGLTHLATVTAAVVGRGGRLAVILVKSSGVVFGG
jgi:hypothetical protein